MSDSVTKKELLADLDKEFTSKVSPMLRSKVNKGYETLSNFLLDKYILIRRDK